MAMSPRSSLTSRCCADMAFWNASYCSRALGELMSEWGGCGDGVGPVDLLIERRHRAAQPRLRGPFLTRHEARGIVAAVAKDVEEPAGPQDRKSTRLNSSHLVISYAVF